MVRTPWRTYSCSTRIGRLGGGAAAATGLDGRLGVQGQDAVAGPWLRVLA
jgi:hypothetical protein